MFHKEILILGCGNILFGDDGFGPAVISFIEANYTIPENACIIDVGTGVREVLFDILLSEKRPLTLVIVDAIDSGRDPGEIFKIDVEELPEKKTDDFSLHQLPSSNMLKELKILGNVNVDIIACQPEKIPEFVKPGLSKRVSEAVTKAGKMIFDYYLKLNK
jgi:coenzyme F420 hydrogenase subunit delta